MPSEWLTIDQDAEGEIYITGLCALNLPTGPLGDWHGTIWHPQEGSGQSTRSEADQGLCRIGTELWGRDGLIDARTALLTIGHPQGKAKTPIWAASHARAVAEMVVDAVLAWGEIHNPDVHSARRWLTTRQRAQCVRMLAEARNRLDEEAQKEHIDKWNKALCAPDGLLRVRPDP